MNSTQIKPLNGRLKQVRKLLKLSQRDFAGRLSIKQGTLSDIERGRISVSSKLADALMEKFNVNAGWFYSGQGDIFNYNLQDENAEIMQNSAMHPASWIKEKLRHRLDELKNDPDWDKSFVIHNQILIKNNKELESFKTVLAHYWNLQRKLFQFISQYSTFYSSDFQGEIFKSLKDGQSEPEIKAHFESFIEQLPALQGIYLELNSYLESIIQVMEKFDRQNLMSEDVQVYLRNQQFEKVSPLKDMHTIPTNL